tara:strand:+ start:1543 stop:3984 length:2442 start_codon:yes stop_codon:yes gene_type:complete
MNVQLYAYENGVRFELDLFEEEPIKITLTAEDILGPEVTSSFSRQFRIPATSKNSRFFKYWFVAGVVDFDITKKVTAEIHVDGILYKTGQLRLLATYANGEADNTQFEIIFLGETKDFSSQVGDIYMSNLDLVDATHTMTLPNVENSWLPLGDPSLLVDGKVRYILAKRGYAYDDNNDQVAVPGQTNPSEIAADNSACVECTQNHADAFTKMANPLFTSQFTPIVQVKYLIDKIFALTDYTYKSGGVFEDAWFQELYIDGIGQAALPYTPNSDGFFQAECFNVQPVPEFTSIPFNIVNQNNANAYSNVTYQYTIPTDGTYEFSSYLRGFVANKNALGQPEPTADAGIYRNGSAVTAAPIQTGSGGSLDYEFNLTYSGLFTAGQVVDVVMSFQNLDFPSSLYEGNFDCTNSPLQIAVNDLMKTDVKVIDWFKSILTKFRLVMVPSVDDPNVFTVEPWQEYIATGQNFDWSNKLDYSKDTKLEPLFYEQANAIVFTDLPDDDQTNTYHQNTFSTVYGQRTFESYNELLTNSKTIDTQFSPTPVDQVMGVPATSNFIIPNFAKNGDALDGNDQFLQSIPLDINQRLLFWNGLRRTDTVTNTNHITWYYTDGVTTKNSGQAPLLQGGPGTDRYPCASYLSEIPSTATTLNLNWNRAFAYFEVGGGPAGTLGESVYERYWKTYIDNIYSPEARLLTAYFNLNSEDLRNLTFDDVIFIKDSYWRLNKIYDAPLGEIATIKCELIKILTYVPPGPECIRYKIQNNNPFVIYADLYNCYTGPQTISVPPGTFWSTCSYTYPTLPEGTTNYEITILTSPGCL